MELKGNHIDIAQSDKVSRPTWRYAKTSRQLNGGGTMKTCKIKIIIVTIAVLALAGCATPYQRTGLTGGFSETRLLENAFSVSFCGNGYTSRERSTDFALLRCAELTLENGFKFFVISSSAQGKKTEYYNMERSPRTCVTVNTLENTSYDSLDNTIPIYILNSSYTIFCFQEKPGNAMVLDANFLSNSIRQKYGMQATQR